MRNLKRLLKITTKVSQPHEVALYSEASNMIPWYIVTMANSQSSAEVEFNSEMLKVFAGPIDQDVAITGDDTLVVTQRLAKASTSIQLGNEINLTRASNGAPYFDRPSTTTSDESSSMDNIKVTNSSGMIIPIGIEMSGSPILLFNNVTSSAEIIIQLSDVLYLRAGKNRKKSLTLEEAKDSKFKKIELSSLLANVINIEISQDGTGAFIYSVTIE